MPVVKCSAVKSRDGIMWRFLETDSRCEERDRELETIFCDYTSGRVSITLERLVIDLDLLKRRADFK